MVLTPDMAAGDFEESFRCSICYNVVKDPKECRQCSNLNCKDCLVRWWEESGLPALDLEGKKCPNCAEKKGFQEVNRLVMGLLNKQEFRCKKCDEIFTYKDFEDHVMNKCTSNIFMPSCELCYKLDFESKELIVMHWRHECLGIKVQCMKCDIEIERVCTPDHDCVDELKQVVKMKDARIELLEATIR